MAGVLTQSNSFKLTGMIGRRPTDGELYIAHFLGVGGAGRLISKAESNPQASAAQLFPAAAAANRSIFYDRSGEPRSVSQVHSVLIGRYAAAANSQTARTAMAAVGGAAVQAGAPPVNVASFAPDNAAYLSALPRSLTSGGLQASAPSPPAAQQVTALTQTRPAFTSLYQPGERQDAISPMVRDLWATGREPASAASTAPALALEPQFKPKTSLDLFSDRAGTFSG